MTVYLYVHAILSAIILLFQHYTDSTSLYALILLYYMLPDTRSKPDHRRIIDFFEVVSCYLIMVSYIHVQLHIVTLHGGRTIWPAGQTIDS